MQLDLPKPPSINHIYGYTCQKGFARSYITKEGKNWFEVASLMLKTQWHGVMVEKPCAVSIVLRTCRRQDVDNILKPILDLLQKTTVIKNDELIYELDINKAKVRKEKEKVILWVHDLDKTE